MNHLNALFIILELDKVKFKAENTKFMFLSPWK